MMGSSVWMINLLMDATCHGYQHIIVSTVGYSTSVHAIQWIVDRGEIELCSGPWGTNMGANIVITNLDENNIGVGATTALNTRLNEIAAEEAAAAAEQAEAEAASESYLSETDLDSIIAALEGAE